MQKWAIINQNGQIYAKWAIIVKMSRYMEKGSYYHKWAGIHKNG